MFMFNNWLATSLKIQRSAFMSWYKLPLVYHCILATLSLPKLRSWETTKHIQIHFGKSKHVESWTFIPRILKRLYRSFREVPVQNDAMNNIVGDIKAMMFLEELNAPGIIFSMPEACLWCPEVSVWLYSAMRKGWENWKNKRGLD